MIHLHELLAAVLLLFCSNNFHVSGYTTTTTSSRLEVTFLSNIQLPSYRIITTRSRIRNQVSCLHARKKSIKSPTAKGFKDKCIPYILLSSCAIVNIFICFYIIVENLPIAVESDPLIALNDTSAAVIENDPKVIEVETRSAEDIFKKYKISDGSKISESKKSKQKLKKKTPQSEDSQQLPPFGEEIMANLPMDVQEKFDKFLISATFITLAFNVLCGIGKYLFSLYIAVSILLVLYLSLTMDRFR